MIEFENLAKLNQPFFEDYKKSFDDSLNKGWFILGEKVKNFENEFNILLNVSAEDLSNFVDDKLLKLILLNRFGKINVVPGYDGKYGVAFFDGMVLKNPEEVEEKTEKKFEKQKKLI